MNTKSDDPLSLLRSFDQTGRLDEILEEDGMINFGNVSSWPKDTKTSFIIRDTVVSLPTQHQLKLKYDPDCSNKDVSSSSSIDEQTVERDVTSSAEGDQLTASLKENEETKIQCRYYTLERLVAFTKSVSAQDRLTFIGYLLNHSSTIPDPARLPKSLLKNKEMCPPQRFLPNCSEDRSLHEPIVEVTKKHKIPQEEVSPAEKKKEDIPSAASFLKLSNEVIAKILSHLSFEDFATRVSLVNHRLRKLCLDTSLWTELEIRRFKFMDFRAAKKLLEKCPLLKRLSISREAESYRLATQALLNCPKLQELAVNGRPHCFDGDFEEMLKALKTHGTSLKSLKLGLPNDGAKAKLASNADCLARLTSISLMDDNRSSHVLKAIGEHCRHLVWFSTNNSMHDRKDFLALSRLFDGVGHTLKHLTLSGHFQAYHFDFISKCQQLQTLKMHNVSWHFGVDERPTLLYEIFALPNLKSLEIRLQNFKDSDHFIAACSQQKMHNSLTEVKIAQGGCLDDEAVKAIAENCPELTVFVLEHAYQVTDVGVKYLLGQCGKLTSLTLGLPGMTGKALEYVPPQLKKLGIMDKYLYDIDSEFMMRLACEHPQLHIFIA